MARLLAVSQTGATTGFARVAGHAARALAEDGHDLHVLGVGADPSWRAHTQLPLDTWTAVHLAGELRPDATLLFGSTAHLNWQVGAVREAFDGRLLAYVPTEGRFDAVGSLPGLAKADALVAYHPYGVRQLRRATSPSRLPIAHIPHPVHAAGAPPLTGSALRTARARQFPSAGALTSGTWILNANRNDARKNIGASIRLLERLLAAGIRNSSSCCTGYRCRATSTPPGWPVS